MHVERENGELGRWTPDEGAERQEILRLLRRQRLVGAAFGGPAERQPGKR
jgi:hypothetical protein